jgi:hypothetical protein
MANLLWVARLILQAPQTRTVEPFFRAPGARTPSQCGIAETFAARTRTQRFGERSSPMNEDYALPIELHRRGCLCVRCLSADHPEACSCWMCESRRFFFESPEPRRELVESDVVAAHLRKLGWSMRKVAAVAGVSVATAWKASRPGRRLEAETVERLLSLKAEA